MKRRSLLAILCGTLALLGCSEGKRIPAVGPGYEIIVLSGGAARPVGSRVAEILSREIVLVRHQPLFVTVDDELSELSFYRTRKILFAVGTPEEEELQTLIRKSTGSNSRTSFPGLWLVKEPYSAGQILFVFTGEVAAMQEVLAERPDDLVAAVEDAVVELLVRNLYRAGEVEGARGRMRRLWGWGVRVPVEWEVDDRFAAEGFVRVWRDAPVKQLFVSWEPGRVERTPAEWLARRDELTFGFYDEDRVSPEHVAAAPDSTPFGDDGIHLEGLWINDKYAIGGPFEAWAFYCPEDDRTYLLDLSVYAPDRSKRPLMRTLEALIRTFRCGCVS